QPYSRLRAQSRQLLAVLVTSLSCRQRFGREPGKGRLLPGLDVLHAVVGQEGMARGERHLADQRRTPERPIRFEPLEDCTALRNVDLSALRALGGEPVHVLDARLPRI